MQRLITFTHTGSSAVFGNFSAGDQLRCGADAARHFVEEAGCAQYADVQTPAPARKPAPTAPGAPVTKPRAKRA